MIGIVILVISILFQFVAAVLAVRLIGVTGKRLAWGLIASAVVLMALRRGISLFEYFGPGPAKYPDVLAESVGLIISSCMTIGISRIAPLFIERKLAEEALRISEERLRSVLDNTPIFVYALDCQGTFTLREGKALYQIGLPPKALVGESVFDLFGSQPFVEKNGLAITAAEVVRRVLAGETISGRSEMNGVCFDNTLAPLWDADGQVTGVVGVGLDVTERQQAEEKIKQQLDELQRWHDVTLNREVRIQELKREVNQLCVQLGESARYASQGD